MAIRKINFRFLDTGLMVIDAEVNTVAGVFILDTGASKSCIDLFYADKFYVITDDESSCIDASGIGESVQSKMSTENLIQIGEWSDDNSEIVVIDMYHINKALAIYDITIHGIIGSDLFQTAKAIIDYSDNSLHLTDIPSE